MQKDEFLAGPQVEGEGTERAKELALVHLFKKMDQQPSTLVLSSSNRFIMVAARHQYFVPVRIMPGSIGLYQISLLAK